MTTTGTQRRHIAWPVAAVGVAYAVLVAALLAGGGASGADLPGLDTPGAGVRWGLPVAKLLLDGSATVMVGFLLVAALLPATRGEVGPDALRALRIASAAAGLLAASAVAVHLLTLADLLGEPVAATLRPDVLGSFTFSVAQGRAYAVVALLAVVVAVATPLTLGHGGALALLALGVGALVPAALTGHSAGGDYHQSAAVSLLVHVVAVALWAGGLVAVSWYAAHGRRGLGRLAGSYSVLALGCFVAVAASGVLNGYLRVGSLSDLVSTPYGLLLLGKVAALLALGWFGWRHRARTLPAVQAGRPGAFRRLAAVEACVMAAAMGLAVALSRTRTPVPDVVPDATRARQLLGFVPPPAPTPARYLTEVYPDAFFALMCLAMVLLYLAGVRRLRARGDRWPVGRTVTWLAGTALLAVSTLSGFMTYAMVLFSTHMVVHMTITMVVPWLLVLGGPITLALRALRPARRGETGPREWLLAGLHSRAARWVTHPVVVWTLFVTAPFTTYFTGAFEYSMRHHTAHLLLHLHFLAAGYLFAEMMVGIDPIPRRLPYPARIVAQFAAMAFHAFFAVAVSGASTVLAARWYAEIGPDLLWLPDALTTQERGGQMAWAAGELPALSMLMVMVVQWWREDERSARRHDRQTESADAELAAYNAYLASLDDRARGRR